MDNIPRGRARLNPGLGTCQGYIAEPANTLKQLKLEDGNCVSKGWYWLRWWKQQIILANTAKVDLTGITSSDAGFFQIRALHHSFVLEDNCVDTSLFVQYWKNVNESKPYLNVLIYKGGQWVLEVWLFHQILNLSTQYHKSSKIM